MEPRPLRVLLVGVEDGVTGQVLSELCRTDHPPIVQRIERLADLDRALAAGDWHLVVIGAAGGCPIDPGLVARISGAAGDAVVIACGDGDPARLCQAGAHDVIGRRDRGRLASAIRRELGAADARREVARLREQMARLESLAALGTMTAGIAHEIKNPLAALIMNLELTWSRLGRRDPGMYGAAPMIDGMREAAERMKAIVADIRDRAQPAAESSRPLEVERVIAAAARLAQPELVARVRLVRQIGAVPPVNASEGRLVQVLVNLLVNAAQASPVVTPRATVMIRARHDRGAVVIEVIDQGPGVPPELRRRIFEPFFTTKQDRGGSGLGLAICHRLIAEIGGVLELDSVPGHGATFRVRLPAVAKPAAAKRLVESAAAPVARPATAPPGRVRDPMSPPTLPGLRGATCNRRRRSSLDRRARNGRSERTPS
jgi:two-component system, NtrC family, sensor kinase